ncbi:MAG: hypothetical protein J6Y20_04775 [Lachnospiraceae bacterium]|nr:hypothetical protein [Kiritimatiellia bacterium]MBP5461420.1 hypothetical protein [Lachnospiraceae bacterium]
MPIQGGLIVPPIYVTDISSAVQNPSLKLFVLGISDEVNKWSKYKPFRHTTRFSGRYQGPDVATPTTDREIAIRAADYGLIAPAAKSNVEATLNTEWAYQKPIPGQHLVSMFDFEFYFPNAVPPANAPGNVSFYIALESNFNFMAAMPVIIIPENIKWADLGAIRDWYLCLYIKAYKNGVAETWLKTATDTFANGGGSLVLTRAEAEIVYNYAGTGPHYYYLCASRARNNTFDAPPTQTQYLALPAASTSAMEGTIEITQKIISTMSIALVSTASPNASSFVRSFLDASNYVGPYFPGDENAWCQLIAANSNSVHFGFDLTGLPDRSVTLSRSSIKITLDSTLWDTVSSFIPTAIYDESGNEYSSITIGAGQTKRFLFALPLGAMNYNGNIRQDNPVTGRHLDVFVSLLYNNVLASKTDIRLKN